MDMLGRRFLLIVALLMGMTALAASIAPRDPTLRDRGSTTPTATPSPPEPAPADGVVEARVEEISAGGRPERVVVERGELVELVVSAPEIGSVSLEGLDRIEAVDPESAARFQIRADQPGEYPIELLDAERRIGTLVIRD
jgi:hypothetical protein